MDAISYAHSAKQEQRIKKFINDPDSTSGVLTVPKTIASGENITIPSGRVAVLPNVQIDGTLNVQGEVFIPSGSSTSTIDTQLATKAPLASPALTGTPTAPTASAGTNNTQVATTAYVDRKMTLMTAQNSTSGTSIDFTGIPSWAKRITIMMKDISTNGVFDLLVQIGANSLQSTGYNSASAECISGSVPRVTGASNGFVVAWDSAIDGRTICMKIILMTGNTYVQEHTGGGSIGRTLFTTGGGSVTLSGVLDRVRILTGNGTDTFDAGQINIMCEG